MGGRVPIGRRLTTREKAGLISNLQYRAFLVDVVVGFVGNYIHQKRIHARAAGNPLGAVPGTPTSMHTIKADLILEHT